MKRIKQLIRNLIYLSKVDLRKEIKPTVNVDLLGWEEKFGNLSHIDMT